MNMYLIMFYISFVFLISNTPSHLIMKSQMNLFEKLSWLISNPKYSMVTNKSNLSLHTMVKAIFALIVSLNVMSLLPYLTPLMSYPNTVFIMGTSLWLTLVIMTLLTNPLILFGSLVPMGAPNYLISALAIIEWSSCIIRPLTLSVRLFVNIMAGHILVTLMGMGPMHTNYLIVPTLLILIFMSALEILVSMVQGYVFSKLIIMYN